MYNVSPLPSLKKKKHKKNIVNNTHVRNAGPLPIDAITSTLSFALLWPHYAAHVKVKVAGGNCEENIKHD